MQNVVIIVVFWSCIRKQQNNGREGYVYSTSNNRKITTSDSVGNELILLRSGINRRTNSDMHLVDSHLKGYTKNSSKTRQVSDTIGFFFNISRIYSLQCSWHNLISPVSCQCHVSSEISGVALLILFSTLQSHFLLLYWKYLSHVALNLKSNYYNSLYDSLASIHYSPFIIRSSLRKQIVWTFCPYH